MRIPRFQSVAVISLVVWIGLLPGCRRGIPGEVTEQQAKAMLDTFVKARNEANPDLLDRIFAPDYIAHDPSQPQAVVGLEAVKRQYAATHRAAPDVKFAIEDFFVKGDRMVSIFTMTGTITGPFGTPMGDLPPTGKSFRLTGAAVDRIVGGKIVESWMYFNPLDVLSAAGLHFGPALQRGRAIEETFAPSRKGPRPRRLTSPRPCP
ncbi:MAG: ester cyclase [Candidatus Moduliflexus flocculans]|nr:ester cyclase [Candidatus Moduliflexus flocculans]